MTVREYIDKLKDLYNYAKDIYPTEEKKSEKFLKDLYISLRGKLNLYTGTTFWGWVEKVIEQEKLDKEFKTSTQVRWSQ